VKRIAPIALSLLVILAGCGGDDDDDAAEPSESSSDVSEEETDDTEAPEEETDDTEAPEEQSGDGEVPQFSSDFNRLCTTQVGFEGAAEYTEGPGPHPAIIFEDVDGEETYIESSGEFPEGWVIEQDSNFEDNSDLAPTELIVCAAHASTTPNGTDCELDNDGEAVSLELVDVTYELTVYSAKTGEQVGEPVQVEAASTDCPFVVAYEEGDTQYFNRLADDDLINALRPVIEGS